MIARWLTLQVEPSYGIRVFGFSGLERWNETVEWTGLEWWNGMEWNGGTIEDLSATCIIHGLSLNCIASYANNILVILVRGHA